MQKCFFGLFRQLRIRISPKTPLLFRLGARFGVRFEQKNMSSKFLRKKRFLSCVHPRLTARPLFEDFCLLPLSLLVGVRLGVRFERKNRLPKFT